MRRTIVLALAAWLAGVSPSFGDKATRDRLIRYFGDWYAYFPNTRISVVEAQEVSLQGLEAYRVQRHLESKSRQDGSLALYDRQKDEVFVGNVLHDEERRAANRAFDPSADLPKIQASLTDLFGLPVGVTVRGAPRGPLKPLVVSISQTKEKEKSALANRSGFISADGATLLLGEFHPLSQTSAAFRERLLAENPGVRSSNGKFLVTEFLDFQCDRCRRRAPMVSKFVGERGGGVEIRFLPLVKVHDWAFAAAEVGAALANIDPALYLRYQETFFARTEGLSASAARELATDVAEAAGVREKFDAELTSGRARARVVKDVELAMRLGITGTPSFLYKGILVAGERDVLEAYLTEKLEVSAPTPADSPSR